MAETVATNAVGEQQLERTKSRRSSVRPHKTSTHHVPETLPALKAVGASD